MHILRTFLQTRARLSRKRRFVDNDPQAARIDRSFGARDVKAHDAAPAIDRSRKSKLDAGILSLGDDARRRLQGGCDAFVQCDYGYEEDNPGVSCAAACAANGTALCCDGESACDYFTGAVCKDGVSCFGDRACYYANIGTVVRSCSEYEACYAAGSDGGSIEQVEDGCVGTSACYNTAAFYGNIGRIENGCLGERACSGAVDGYYGYIGFGAAGVYGRIGLISGSCVGESTCAGAAGYVGRIGIISGSCKDGEKTCYYAGQLYGSIQGILNSCKEGERACADMAYEYGNTGTIQDSCDGTFAW